MGGGIRNVRGPEVLASGILAGARWGWVAARGPGQGDSRGGLLGVGGGAPGAEGGGQSGGTARSATQWNEWAINSGQWAACVRPLRAAGALGRRCSPAPRPELQTNLEPPPCPTAQ